jgi:hypothetical protein
MTPENALVSRRAVFERDGVITFIEVWDTDHPDSPFIALEGMPVSPYIRRFEMPRAHFKQSSIRLKDDAAPVVRPPCTCEIEQDDDPSAHKRWVEGCDFALLQLCSALDVAPKSVRWDAATETLDGDVNAVIWNILRAKLGDDWEPGALEAENARLKLEVAGEQEANAKWQHAMRKKEAAMGVLFDRLKAAGADVSDLIS